VCDFENFPADESGLHGKDHDKKEAGNNVGSEFSMLESCEAFVFKEVKHAHKDRALF